MAVSAGTTANTPNSTASRPSERALRVLSDWANPRVFANGASSIAMRSGFQVYRQPGFSWCRNSSRAFLGAEMQWRPITRVHETVICTPRKEQRAHLAVP